MFDLTSTAAAAVTAVAGGCSDPLADMLTFLILSGICELILLT
jgi:hypothetical protein